MYVIKKLINNKTLISLYIMKINIMFFYYIQILSKTVGYKLTSFKIKNGIIILIKGYPSLNLFQKNPH